MQYPTVADPDAPNPENQLWYAVTAVPESVTVPVPVTVTVSETRGA
jgi:hypothetical protein